MVGQRDGQLFTVSVECEMDSSFYIPCQLCVIYSSLENGISGLLHLLYVELHNSPLQSSVKLMKVLSVHAHLHPALSAFSIPSSFALLHSSYKHL